MKRKSLCWFDATIFAVIILMACQAKAKGPLPPVQRVTQWQFDQSGDINYDNWPDNWRRRQGRQYPAYLLIQIAPKHPRLMEAALRADHQFRPYRQLAGRLGLSKDWQFSETLVDRYLSVQLNGGAAVVQSPPVAVSSLYSYRFSGSLFTRGLQHSAAWIEYLFIDSSGEAVGSTSTKKFTGDISWTHVALDPLVAPPKAASVIVRLHVEPQGKADIYGEAGFDNLCIESLPQLQLTTDQPRGIYAVGQDVLATCQVSGLANPVTRLRFGLLSPDGELLADFDASLAEIPGSDETAFSPSLTGSWRLPSLGPGFYRLEAQLYDGQIRTHTTTATVAVMENLLGTGGPFGWTLGTGHDPVSRRDLPQWLQECGVSWVKYPCWLDRNDFHGADELAWMMERLQERGINSVGMLDQPPAEPRSHSEPNAGKPLAPLLRDPADWRPQLEALMTRLSMRTTWWQIGGEGDHSFLRYPNLPEKVDEIRRELQGFGQPIRVALSWPWLEPLPTPVGGGWKAICLTESEAFTRDELDANLKSVDSDVLDKWIVLDPLDARRYSLEDRISDLVGRMVAVRRHNVRVAFISNPFDAKLGLLNADATPGAMLLPWRTTASIIGSLRYEGSLRMPNGSDNVVLADEHRGVVVVWSHQPAEERIYLGDDVKQIDVWGRISDVSVDDDGRQIVQVGTLPTFLVNINPVLAKFRLAARLESTRLESLPGRQQEIQLSMTNTFGSVIAGQYTIRTPVTWETQRQGYDINIAELATVQSPIKITLRSNAAIGRELLRFDFTVDTDQRHRFSIWRDVDVGPEDIQIDPSIRFDSTGALVVTVNMSNLSERPLDYNCYLLTQAQSRRHQRIQMTVGPLEQVSREFVWEEGADLLGTTLTLQAEDRNSKRVLIYPITVEQ